ncbi:MAG: AraC family transcriptional regulator [Sebaldella sp.]|nr:AraC family transcriptional regulator [Sebaldella sp.]
MKKAEFQGKKIVGIKVRTKNADNQSEKDMSKLWSSFMSENIMEKIPNKIDLHIYTIYTNYESDFTGEYDVILGCEVSSTDNLPSGLISQEFPNMSGLIFESKGQIPESIVKTWNEIWTTPLDRAYIADIEKYKISDFQDENAVVEIFISMK